MLALLAVLLFTVALFAYIGRTSVPARERIPVIQWSSKDLYRNAWRGLDLCSSRTPLGRMLEGRGGKSSG
ncbi:hypothetical protein [Nesterenkonia sp. Act20]|uniref:hypothetical protein n=1 Tax=Nesterenkonia sp. Act20 TaxID=1483432 RepID=UPI001C43E4CA|nr:hypothetical protein [Nesterenkonia sp. Act20]